MASIHGNLLEVSVVGCNIFSDEIWALDSLCVCFEYGANKSIVFISADGRILPTFEIFVLVEGHREIKFVVCKNIDIHDHNHPLSYDNFMGSGKVHLHNVLSQGYDASSWSLKKGHNSHAGVLKLRLKYAYANRLIDPPSSSSSSSSRAATTEKMAPPYGYNNNIPDPYFTPHPPTSNYSHPYYNYFPPPPNYSHYSYYNYPPPLPPTPYPYYPPPPTTSHPSPPAAPTTSHHPSPPAAKPSFWNNVLTATTSTIMSGLFSNMFQFFGG